MARDYLAVLKSLGYGQKNLQIVTRGEEGAKRFETLTGVSCRSGGVTGLELISEETLAIVAVSHEQLAGCAEMLMVKGCRHLLVEKPGALYEKDLRALEVDATKVGARIWIAFNRRFFDSVQRAREMILEDGGAISGFFDFTEMEERVLAPGPDGRSPSAEVLSRWGIVNSLHVMDLFFYLAGIPREWRGGVHGSLSWHSTGSVYHGSGVTDRGTIFSYLSTWSGSGRWGVEITTSRRKLVLRPLEGLIVQPQGSFRMETLVEPVSGELKPGLEAQVLGSIRAMAGERVEGMCSISEARRHYDMAEKILHYEAV